MSIDQIFPQIKFAHVNADNIKMPFTQMEGTEAVLGAERQLLSEENRAQRRHFVDVIHDELGKRLLSQNRESLPPSTYKDQYGKKTRISFEPIKGKPKPKLEPMKVPSKQERLLLDRQKEEAREMLNRNLFVSTYERAFSKQGVQSPAIIPISKSPSGSEEGKKGSNSSLYQSEFVDPQTVNEKLCKSERKFGKTKLLYNIGEDAPDYGLRAKADPQPTYFGVRDIFKLHSKKQEYKTSYCAQYNGQALGFPPKNAKFEPQLLYARTLALMEKLEAEKNQ